MEQINCDACLIVAGTVNTTLNREEVTDILAALSTMVCGVKLELHVCKGFIDYYLDGIIENIFEINLNPGYMCQKFLKICHFPQFKEQNPKEFINAVLADKPEHLEEDNFVD
jgi:hypothetical protein